MALCTLSRVHTVHALIPEEVCRQKYHALSTRRSSYQSSTRYARSAVHFRLALPQTSSRYHRIHNTRLGFICWTSPSMEPRDKTNGELCKCMESALSLSSSYSFAYGVTPYGTSDSHEDFHSLTTSVLPCDHALSGADRGFLSSGKRTVIALLPMCSASWPTVGRRILMETGGATHLGTWSFFPCRQYFAIRAMLWASQCLRFKSGCHFKYKSCDPLWDRARFCTDHRRPARQSTALTLILYYSTIISGGSQSTNPGLWNRNARK